MGLGQLALSGILGALAQPGLEPGEGPRTPTLQLPDRHAELPGDGLDRLTPQQAQHHLVLASQAPALAGRERTSPSRLPCDGQHGRAALALAAHKPSRIDHRLSITFHAVVLQFLGTIRCPEKPRAAQSGVQVPQKLRNRLDGPPPFTLSCARFVFEIEEVMKPNP